MKILNNFRKIQVKFENFLKDLKILKISQLKVKYIKIEANFQKFLKISHKNLRKFEDESLKKFEKVFRKLDQ